MAVFQTFASLAAATSRALRILEERLWGHIVVRRGSWRWHFDTARRRKPYAFDAHRWTDLDGRPTGVPQAA